MQHIATVGYINETNYHFINLSIRFTFLNTVIVLIEWIRENFNCVWPVIVCAQPTSRFFQSSHFPPNLTRIMDFSQTPVKSIHSYLLNQVRTYYHNWCSAISIKRRIATYNFSEIIHVCMECFNPVRLNDGLVSWEFFGAGGWRSDAFLKYILFFR